MFPFTSTSQLSNSCRCCLTSSFSTQLLLCALCDPQFPLLLQVTSQCYSQEYSLHLSAVLVSSLLPGLRLHSCSSLCPDGATIHLAASALSSALPWPSLLPTQGPPHACCFSPTPLIPAPEPLHALSSSWDSFLPVPYLTSRQAAEYKNSLSCRLDRQRSSS